MMLCGCWAWLAHHVIARPSCDKRAVAVPGRYNRLRSGADLLAQQRHLSLRLGRLNPQLRDLGRAHAVTADGVINLPRHIQSFDQIHHPEDPSARMRGTNIPRT